MPDLREKWRTAWRIYWYGIGFYVFASSIYLFENIDEILRSQPGALINAIRVGLALLGLLIFCGGLLFIFKVSTGQMDEDR